MQKLTICDNGCVKLAYYGRRRRMPDGFLDVERIFACSNYVEVQQLADIIHRYRTGKAIHTANKLQTFLLKLLVDFCGKDNA